MILYYNPQNKKYAQTNRNQLNMTEAEGKLWNLGLKGNKRGYRFLRQRPIGNYILDFYCHRLKLGIEIDDTSHDLKGEYDTIRTEYLNSIGIKIIRYTNHNIYKQLEGVIVDIERKIIDRKNELNT